MYTKLPKICFVILVALFQFTGHKILGQEMAGDPVLFSVDEEEVRVSEFNYIYNKNNASNADYSRASLQEYLDLYIKFKLKVKKARDLQMDTISSLQQELAGYRKQLADSYLLDKEVKNKLIEEAYDREGWDLHTSHILVKIQGPRAARDTNTAYRKAMFIRNQITSPDMFSDIARKYSEDATVRENGGDLGYLTAILPSGFYRLENVLYRMKPGEISMPVRSGRGYHILMLHDRRPARGEMEVAHILVRKGKNDSDKKAAMSRIETVYQYLEGGGSFEEAARTNSEDKATSANGGYIGFMSVGTYEEAFEDAVFALTEDGQYTRPIETKVGYHIVKRISKLERGTVAQERRRIENELNRTERILLAKEKLIEMIKAEGRFSESENGFNRFVSTLDSTFYDFNWRISNRTPSDVLFTIGGQRFTGTDFGLYLTRQRRKRLQLARSSNIPAAATALYKDFVEESILQFEESRLEDKYPDFRALMREYEEGILLFELTNRMVWTRASKDSVGLQKFYETHRKDYQWEERALVQYFTIDSTDRNTLEKIYTMAAKKPAAKVKKKFNKKIGLVSVLEKKFEKDNRNLEDLEWRKGFLTPLPEVLEGGKYFFTKIAQILPPEPKELHEAKGYVIADYQDHLEKEWVETLRGKYKVRVKDEVFESLVKE